MTDRSIGAAVDIGEGVSDGFAVEEPFAGEEFLEHDAERPDVGAAVDIFSGGAENQSGFGGA